MSYKIASEFWKQSTMHHLCKSIYRGGYGPLKNYLNHNSTPAISRFHYYKNDLQQRLIFLGADKKVTRPYKWSEDTVETVAPKDGICRGG